MSTVLKPKCVVLLSVIGENMPFEDLLYTGVILVSSSLNMIFLLDKVLRRLDVRCLCVFGNLTASGFLKFFSRNSVWRKNTNGRASRACYWQKSGYLSLIKHSALHINEVSG